MSKGRLTSASLTVKLIGVVVIVLGLLLAFFSLNTDVGVIDASILTPIGLIIALPGIFMILAKEY